MLMDRRTTLPSAEAPLDFYLRVLYGKRVGILVDVGEAVGYDCLHMWLHELHYAEQKPESRHIRRMSFVLSLIQLATNHTDILFLLQFAREDSEDLKDLFRTQIQPWIEACYSCRENLKSRLCSFDTAYLPKIIQEAITLTRMMNIHYLWVDAICIIKSNPFPLPTQALLVQIGNL